MARRHEVTLFACGGSRTRARLVSYYNEPLGTDHIHPLSELPHLLHAYLQAAEFDVVHDHASAVGSALGALLSSPPVVKTLHGRPSYPRVKPLCGLVGDRINFVAISEFQRKQNPELSCAATIYHGIDLSQYPFRPDKKESLLFLGRMSPEKGVHLAVQTGHRLGRPLVIATKMAEAEERQYFGTVIKPMLRGDEEIHFEPSPVEKRRLLGEARCLLMPIQWAEPFGLVMIEAMACGTPVVALRKGSAQEIVEDSVTGYVVDDREAFVDAAGHADAIDPADCRERVERLFSARTMVNAYERLYEQLVRPHG